MKTHRRKNNMVARPSQQHGRLKAGGQWPFWPPEFLTGGICVGTLPPRNPPPLPSAQSSPEDAEVLEEVATSGRSAKNHAFWRCMEAYIFLLISPWWTLWDTTNHITLRWWHCVTHKTSNNSPRGPHPSAPCVHPKVGILAVFWSF